MNYLFSKEGKIALSAALGADCLLAFDFDGTLSPSVLVPDHARMPSSIARGFQTLCETASVAIITGRSVADVASRLPIAPKYLVGNHGAEGVTGDDDDDVLAYRAICEAWMHQIMDNLALEKVDPGLRIEHKTCSICMHYRLALDPKRTADEVGKAVLGLVPPPHIVGGKWGINLLPPGAPNKRRALERLLMLEGSRSAFFVGDDETDEIVFRQAPPDWVTVRIGHARDSAARYFLHHQCEMSECLHLLTKLAAAHKEQQPGQVL